MGKAARQFPISVAVRAMGLSVRATSGSLPRHDNRLSVCVGVLLDRAAAMSKLDNDAVGLNVGPGEAGEGSAELLG